MNNAEFAKEFVNAIKEIANKPDNLENDVWMEKFVKTPEGLVNELKTFAEMEF